MRCSILAVLLIAACYDHAPPASCAFACGPGSACPDELSCTGGMCQDPAGPPCTVDPNTSCWDHWRAGVPSFSAAENLAELNSTDYEFNPSISFDGLYLYFLRIPAAGGSRAFHWTRRDRLDAPWSEPQEIAGLGVVAKNRCTVTADNARAICHDEMTDALVEFEVTDRDQFIRPNPLQVVLPIGIGQTADSDPEIDPTGQTLYYAGNVESKETLFVAKRNGAMFETMEVALPRDRSTTQVSDPSISPDGDVLVFSMMTLAAPERRLYFSTLRAGTWDEPRALPITPGGTYDRDAELSPDGCELYWTSPRQGNNTTDIFVAQVVGVTPG